MEPNPEYRRKSLPAERNPEPQNGAAKVLFASDLRAVATGELSLRHEEDEKVLLRIGERLGLRGKEIDGLHSHAIAKKRAEATSDSLKLLKGMTLTVVDGDFPREVIASRNLTFGEYRMPARRNGAENYNARTKSPQQPQPGVLHVGAFDWSQQDTASKVSHTSNFGVYIALLFAISLFGLIIYNRRRTNG